MRPPPHYQHTFKPGKYEDYDYKDSFAVSNAKGIAERPFKLSPRTGETTVLEVFLDPMGQCEPNSRNTFSYSAGEIEIISTSHGWPKNNLYKDTCFIGFILNESEIVDGSDKDYLDGSEKSYSITCKSTLTKAQIEANRIAEQKSQCN